MDDFKLPGEEAMKLMREEYSARVPQRDAEPLAVLLGQGGNAVSEGAGVTPNPITPTWSERQSCDSKSSSNASPGSGALAGLRELCERQASLLLLLVVKCTDNALRNMLEQLIVIKEAHIVQFGALACGAEAEQQIPKPKGASVRHLFKEISALQNQVLLKIAETQLWEFAVKELLFSEIFRFIQA